MKTKLTKQQIAAQLATLLTQIEPDEEEEEIELDVLAAYEKIMRSVKRQLKCKLYPYLLLCHLHSISTLPCLLTN